MPHSVRAKRRELSLDLKESVQKQARLNLSNPLPQKRMVKCDYIIMLLIVDTEIVDTFSVRDHWSSTAATALLLERIVGILYFTLSNKSSSLISRNSN